MSTTNKAADGALTDEHPAVRRMRERFEAEHGDLADVVRAAQAWHRKWCDFDRPYNRDMEHPVLEPDVDAALDELKAAVRAFAALHTQGQAAPQPQPQAAAGLTEAERLYQWLLHNGGLLNEWPKDWRPGRDGPLIPWLDKRVRRAALSAQPATPEQPAQEQPYAATRRAIVRAAAALGASAGEQR